VPGPEEALVLASSVPVAHTATIAAGRYLSWGVVQISLTNLLIIVGMIVVFAAALVLPFPGSHDDAGQGGHDELD
jgi:hypothetical protein